MFIDTSGWFSIFDSSQGKHSLSLRLYGQAGRRVTHSYVIAEFVALSEARKKHRDDMLRFLSFMLDDEEVEIVWVDETVTRDAVDLLTRRADKEWSLCDAVSFVVMDNLGLTDALTTDHHFEQAGYVKLLES